MLNGLRRKYSKHLLQTDTPLIIMVLTEATHNIQVLPSVLQLVAKRRLRRLEIHIEEADWKNLCREPGTVKH